MQKLNSEQEYIKDKYSINGKKINVFRGDIKQDLSHDLKIFGKKYLINRLYSSVSCKLNQENEKDQKYKKY